MNLPRPTLAIGLLVWSLPVLAQPALTDAPQQQEQAATRAQPDYREQLLAYELGAITVVEDESGLRALDSAGRTLDAGPLSLALGDTSSFDAHRQRARRIRRLSATARIAGGALVLTGYGLAQVTNFDPLAGPYDGLGLAVPVSLLAGGGLFVCSFPCRGRAQRNNDRIDTWYEPTGLRQQVEAHNLALLAAPMATLTGQEPSEADPSALEARLIAEAERNNAERRFEDEAITLFLDGDGLQARNGAAGSFHAGELAAMFGDEDVLASFDRRRRLVRTRSSLLWGAAGLMALSSTVGAYADMRWEPSSGREPWLPPRPSAAGRGNRRRSGGGRRPGLAGGEPGGRAGPQLAGRGWTGNIPMREPCSRDSNRRS
jgi:hypothetical protein